MRLGVWEGHTKSSMFIIIHHDQPHHFTNICIITNIAITITATTTQR